jgi:hypothetical protein
LNQFKKLILRNLTDLIDLSKPKQDLSKLILRIFLIFLSKTISFQFYPKLHCLIKKLKQHSFLRQQINIT